MFLNSNLEIYEKMAGSYVKPIYHYLVKGLIMP